MPSHSAEPCGPARRFAATASTPSAQDSAPGAGSSLRTGRYIVAFAVAALVAGLTLRGSTETTGADGGRPARGALALPAPSASPTAMPSPTVQPPNRPPDAADTAPANAPPPNPGMAGGPGGAGVQAHLTTPHDLQRLTDDQDFQVAGTARGLGEDDLRIFIRPAASGIQYLADYRPARVGADGSWQTTSTGIGSGWGHSGDVYLVQAVRAGKICRASLDGLELGHDHYPSFNGLPQGCQVLAQVRVIEQDPPPRYPNYPGYPGYPAYPGYPGYPGGAPQPGPWYRPGW
jgi:hypothetical protein